MSKFTEGMYTKGHGIKSRDMPQLCDLLRQQLTTDRAEIARNLGISPRTLQRYEADNAAPRSIMLALYHESDSGRQAAHLQLFNEARAFAQLSASLERHLQEQRRFAAALRPSSAKACNSAFFCCQLELFEPPACSDAA